MTSSFRRICDVQGLSLSSNWFFRFGSLKLSCCTKVNWTLSIMAKTLAAKQFAFDKVVSVSPWAWVTEPPTSSALSIVEHHPHGFRCVEHVFGTGSTIQTISPPVPHSPPQPVEKCHSIEFKGLSYHTDPLLCSYDAPSKKFDWLDAEAAVVLWLQNHVHTYSRWIKILKPWTTLRPHAPKNFKVVFFFFFFQGLRQVGKRN